MHKNKIFTKILLSLVAFSVLGNAVPSKKHPVEKQEQSTLIAPLAVTVITWTVRYLFVFFTVKLTEDIALDKVKELASTDVDMVAYCNEHYGDPDKDIALGLAYLAGKKMGLTPRRRKEK